jgi:hypothetical protein
MSEPPYSYYNPAPKRLGQPGRVGSGKRARKVAQVPKPAKPVKVAPPPAPIAAPPPALPRLRTEPAEPFDAIREAEIAVENARDNPRRHLAALRVLASLCRFAGQAGRQRAAGAARSVASSGHAGGGAGSALDDAQEDAFLASIDHPTEPSPEDWQAFLKAAGMPLNTPWDGGQDSKPERIIGEVDYARQLVLDRISESLADT